jgi:putative transposase
MVGKKIKGRKRHITVDSCGHLLHIQVHAANIHDTVAGCLVFERVSQKHPRLHNFSADAGYRGTSVTFVEKVLKRTLHISPKVKAGWAVIAKRWIVERTFAWIGHYRRMAKDFEILTTTAENFIRIAMIQIMLGKLA